MAIGRNILIERKAGESHFLFVGGIEDNHPSVIGTDALPHPVGLGGPVDFTACRDNEIPVAVVNVLGDKTDDGRVHDGRINRDDQFAFNETPVGSRKRADRDGGYYGFTDTDGNGGRDLRLIHCVDRGADGGWTGAGLKRGTSLAKSSMPSFPLWKVAIHGIGFGLGSFGTEKEPDETEKDEDEKKGDKEPALRFLQKIEKDAGVHCGIFLGSVAMPEGAARLPGPPSRKALEAGRSSHCIVFVDPADEHIPGIIGAQIVAVAFVVPGDFKIGVG